MTEGKTAADDAAFWACLALAWALFTCGAVMAHKDKNIAASRHAVFIAYAPDHHMLVDEKGHALLFDSRKDADNYEAEFRRALQ